MMKPHRSCTATMWQPHPHTKRPKTSVARSAAAKNTKPALTYPSSRVYIDSDGSTGDSVRPLNRNWVACAAIATCTATSVAARHRLRFDLRTRDSFPVPATGSRGSATSTATLQRPCVIALRAFLRAGGSEVLDIGRVPAQRAASARVDRAHEVQEQLPGERVLGVGVGRVARIAVRDAPREDREVLRVPAPDRLVGQRQATLLERRGPAEHRPEDLVADQHQVLGLSGDRPHLVV